MMDGTTVRARRRRAGAKSRKDRAIERYRGGLVPKIHTLMMRSAIRSAFS